MCSNRICKLNSVIRASASKGAFHFWRQLSKVQCFGRKHDLKSIDRCPRSCRRTLRTQKSLALVTPEEEEVSSFIHQGWRLASVVTRNIELEFIKTKMNVSEAFTPVWAQSGCQHLHVINNVKGSTPKITRSEGFGLCIGFALCL